MSKVVVLKHLREDELDDWEKTLKEVFHATDIKRTKQSEDDFTLEGKVAD
jgi:hypothetical protein